jgi:rifampin ADP-ribosylating transferase
MTEILDAGPFFHGTKAKLNIGDELIAGFKSNYNHEVTMNHVYFTALKDGAGFAAELAVILDEKSDNQPHVYQVEPTGVFENDPNVTDKKFPGNPTRSYRSAAPLKVVAEITDYQKTPAETLAKWQEKLQSPKLKGEILN